MEELLVKLMKLEPSERMTFTEFFDDQWGQGDYQGIKEIKEGYCR